MPVTNQWRQKAKVEEPQPPPPQPPAGKKATEAEEPAGRKGRFSQASKKDEKQTKAAEAAKQQSEEEEEDSAGEEEESNQPGRIRNLAGFFATQKDDPKNVKKKRFEVDESEETIILENEPSERLEGVIRSDDPGEWQKPIELEKGWAKNMANIFQNRPLEDSFASKKPFKMDIEEGAETIVLENEPVILEGVVRSVDKTEDVIGKRGRIKNIAGRFANPQAAGSGDEDGGYRREAIDDSSWSRNAADKWKQQQYEDSTPSGGGGGGGKPKWMLELESAKEYGVFENEPEVRGDVVHADDEQPDVISAQHTRNLRKMWSQIEKDEIKEKEPRRPNIVIRPKKKEPSPEPELPPPPKPVEEPKTSRRFGSAAAAAAAPGSVRGNVGAFGSVYGKLAKKEKTPPPPEPEPPPKQPARRGFRQAQQPVSPPTNPEPEVKSPFKTSLKPVPRRK